MILSIWRETSNSTHLSLPLKSKSFFQPKREPTLLKVDSISWLSHQLNLKSLSQRRPVIAAKPLLMSNKKLTQMPREQSVNWELPSPCNLNWVKNGPTLNLDPSSVSTTVKLPLKRRKISGSKLSSKNHHKFSKSSFKREVITTLSNATKASKRISLTDSDLITRSMVSGRPIKKELSLKQAKTKTILPKSKEKFTSMNNSLPTKSEFTSQVLRQLVPVMDSSAEELMS